MRLAHQEVNEEQGVREAMMTVGDPEHLLPHPAARPLNERSTIEVPRQQGPGIQQMAYRVADIDAVCATLRERSLRLLYDEPKRGTSGVARQLHPPKDAGACWSSSSGRPTPTEALLTCVQPGYRWVISRPARATPLPTPAQEPTQHILDAITAGNATRDDFANLEIPDHYRAATVHKGRGRHVRGHPHPRQGPAQVAARRGRGAAELGPGEALVAVMASAINYNTVWTSIFEPVSTFGFLQASARRLSPLTKRHDLPYHVVGSRPGRRRAAHGPGVTKWKPGTEVVAHCPSVELEEPDGHDDTMLDPQQRIWGFETNFGGLADVALVKANQLMPKPAHLTWEEAASPGLVNCNGVPPAGLQERRRHTKQGDNVLIWGASGGLGGFATQYALNGGATPVCVVSSGGQGRDLPVDGRRGVINRNGEGYQFWKDRRTRDPKEWKRFGAKIRVS